MVIFLNKWINDNTDLRFLFFAGPNDSDVIKQISAVDVVVL